MSVEFIFFPFSTCLANTSSRDSAQESHNKNSNFRHRVTEGDQEWGSGGRLESAQRRGGWPGRRRRRPRRTRGGSPRRGRWSAGIKRYHLKIFKKWSIDLSTREKVFYHYHLLNNLRSQCSRRSHWRSTRGASSPRWGRGSRGGAGPTRRSAAIGACSGDNTSSK